MFINDFARKKICSIFHFPYCCLDIITRQSHSEYALIRVWTLLLYGTYSAPQKSDEPRQQSSFSSSPSSILFNNNNYSLNTFYRPTVNNYGTTSLYINNRKLPKTTAAPNVRKNGKQKGKNRTTTPKPNYTTVMLNQFSSMKVTKNKSKSTIPSFNRVTTTTIRPRTTEVKPNGGKSGNFLSKGGKLQESSLYEKLSGKGPKQIKEMSTPSPMLKMFERYEKIQEIYPQLKPYRGDNDNPTYFTVSNAKPSRENSKSSSFISTPQKKDERQLTNSKGRRAIFP
jgi:hypothetical protein